MFDGPVAATLGLIGVVAVSIWLLAVGVLALTAPARALGYLGKFGSTTTINTVELTLRALAGLAFVARAPASKFPDAMALVGWFLIASALILAFVPLRLHNGFASHWAAKISPLWVRIIGAATIVAAPLIAWVAI